MKNWKTTLIGALLAIGGLLQNYLASGGSLADWKDWIVPALVLGLGFLAKDGEQAQPQPPEPPTFRCSHIAFLAALLTAASALVLSSCAGWSVSVRSPYGSVNSDKSGTVTIVPEPVAPIVIPIK